MEMEEAEGFTVSSYVPIESLPYDKTLATYTLVEMDDPNTGVCVCVFVVHECVCVWVLCMSMFIMRH